MNIEYYRKEVYGNTLFYIANADTANTIKNLTGSKTLTPSTKASLIKLGFTFTEIINPN